MLWNIFCALVVLGVLGALFGVVLAISSKVFAVQKDDRFDPVLESLPGANCGGCGFAGCSACAEAILAGTAPVSACPVGGEESARKISTIMGVEPVKSTRVAAFVNCSGGNNAQKRYDYMGLKDCYAAMRLSGSPNECAYGCLGLGTCVAHCQFGAISIKNGVAVVNHELCRGCLQCVNICPRHIIHAVPYYADVNVACSSHSRGAELRKICNIGCLGCRICERTCQHDAIHVTDNLASIDYDKCIGCGECAVKCPRHLISDSNLDRSPRVVIPSRTV